MTLNLTTMTLRIKGLFATLSINDALSHDAKCRILLIGMLNVSRVSILVLSVVGPCKEISSSIRHQFKPQQL
jgi:hypothetical protein